MTREQLIEGIELKQEIDRRKVERKLLTYYPEAGPLRRELYPRSLEFFTAGTIHRERLMLAANRVGKSEGVGGYELTMHLTGWYPEWWPGRRFEKQVRAWACGDTSKTVREIIQHKLFGPPGSWGTGLIPGECIHRIIRSAGIPDTIDSAWIVHKPTGKYSHLVLKSYDQRREAYQGTEQDVIWLDEEPPLDIYTECLMRTMTNNGLVMLTFTPLQGVSDVVLSFLPSGNFDDGATVGRFVVMATWADAPHLSDIAKEELWRSIPPFQRDARSKGIPQLGAGAIYPVGESDIVTEPFEIPAHYRRGYGMDVGWNCTAAVWGALDRDADQLYLTHEYKRSMAEPSIHTHGIKVLGDWIPGFIDPASRGRSQKDGSQLLDDYRQLGLRLTLADNGVESGLYAVWNRMSTGRLKVFSTLKGWLTEFRLYRRDDKGRVVKENDHLMDCTRYLESRTNSMIVKPPPKVAPQYIPHGPATAWS